MKYAIAALAAAVALPSVANAAVVVETRPQTTDGQTFNFALPVAGTPGGPGSLSFLIRGDFTEGSSAENFSFNLENILAGGSIGATAGNILERYGPDDNLFRVSYALTFDQLTQLAADGVFNLVVNYSGAVNAGLSANPFIQATIEYPGVSGAIPEPATWALMIAGFGATGAALRRRRSTRTSVRFA